MEVVGGIRKYAQTHDFPLSMRIGISTGQVISGVIGLKKLSFDLWGETVNLASRMESSSESGQIQVTEATFWRLHEKYDFAPRGIMDIEGIGKIETYFLLEKKQISESSSAASG